MDSNKEFVSLNNFNNDEVINQMKQYALEFDVPIILDEGLAMLLYLIKERKVKKILEIGCAIGYSAINMALVNTDILIDTIERDEKMFEKALNNIKEIGLNERINAIFADALEIDISLLRDDYDLIFIDAAKAQYIKFFEKFTPLLKKGGVVFSDNLLFHGLVYGDRTGLSKNLLSLVKKVEGYNNWLKCNNDYDTTFLPLGDGVAVSVKK